MEESRSFTHDVIRQRNWEVIKNQIHGQAGFIILVTNSFEVM